MWLMRATLSVLALATSLQGQGVQRGEPAAPSRADSMLAVGRLAAAEQALYAAADARPRAPEPRGALAVYLASRGRFRIAEILFQEAVRFGADPGAAQRALFAIAPYRVAAPDGEVVTLRITPATEGLFSFPLRLGSEDVTATFDPRVRGVVVGRMLADRALRGRRLAALRAGTRELGEREVRVDSLMSPDGVRIGLDVLWALHPQVDERRLELTLGRAPNPMAVAANATRVPFLLTFPGMLLVPTVGRPPVALESREGRELLRGARWQVDAATATLIVER